MYLGAWNQGGLGEGYNGGERTHASQMQVTCYQSALVTC